VKEFSQNKGEAFNSGKLYTISEKSYIIQTYSFPRYCFTDYKKKSDA